MSFSSQLIQKFTLLPSSQLMSLQKNEIETILRYFHSKTNEQAHPQEQQCMDKTKTIKKISNKNDMRRYLRTNIKKIIQRNQRNFNIQSTQQTELARKNQQNKYNCNKDEAGKPAKLKQSKSQYIKVFQRNEITMMNNIQIQDLACPICLQFLIRPALTKCGHQFCLQCFDENLLFNNTCPSCRENIKGLEPIRSKLLSQLLKTKISQFTLDQRQRYSQRIHKYKDWKSKRYINYRTLTPGLRIDVRDTQNIWCQGRILKIFQVLNPTLNQYQNSAILVHYDRWHNLYNEVIDLPSSRLSPFQNFTSRFDIQRYNLIEDDENIRGTVILGPPRPPQLLAFQPEEDAPSEMISAPSDSSQSPSSSDSSQSESSSDSSSSESQQNETPHEVQAQSGQGVFQYPHINFSNRISIHGIHLIFEQNPHFDRNADNHQEQQNIQIQREEEVRENQENSLDNIRKQYFSLKSTVKQGLPDYQPEVQPIYDQQEEQQEIGDCQMDEEKPSSLSDMKDPHNKRKSEQRKERNE